jgi:hypothetical protein
VQAAREAARRMQCMNNLKQIALAVHNYENATREFPPAYVNIGQAQHNMLTYILPQMEQQAIFDKYDFTRPWNNSFNRLAVENEISGFRCPSAPKQSNAKWISDYAACTLFTTPARTTLLSGNHIQSRSDWQSVLQQTSTTVADVRDGLSNSFLFFEDSGRPTNFRKTGPQPGNVSGARWADVESYFHVHDTCGGTSVMNCHNNNEIFSFHSGGCIFAVADGSVRFESDTISPEVFVSLFTRAAGDIVNQP